MLFESAIGEPDNGTRQGNRTLPTPSGIRTAPTPSSRRYPVNSLARVLYGEPSTRAGGSIAVKKVAVCPNRSK